MMFSEYKVQVLGMYKLKKKEGSLALNLMQPTPARLKRECLIAFERIKDEDLKILSDFFGPRENLTAYVQAIKRIETDKFRPLEGFLKGKVQNPDDKNIELLAWLINFPQRPYKFGAGGLEKELIPTEIVEVNKVHQPLSKDDQQMISGAGVLITTSNEITGPLLPSKAWHSPFSKYKKPILITGIVFILGVVGVSIRRTEIGNSLPELLKSGQPCMYWTGQQYSKIACDQQGPNTTVIGLDQTRLDHFKKISRLDSISESDVGKVWYYKIKRNKVEFYTSGGTHPEFPKKHLKPMTMYMYNKYIKPFKK
jgi:hypothetical protein